MEFRAQEEDHHHHHNSEQMRATSATATSSLGFNTSTAHTQTKPESRHHQHQHQSSGGTERRRSSISNTHNGNSTPTTGLINIATNTSNNCTIATQTLDQNFQPTPARPRDPEIATATTPSGAKSKTASSSTSSVKYKECLKNHAASVGGSVFDGCGEFMPSGEEGSLEALKCAACQCHRNFHRKEIDGESAPHLLYSPGSRRSSTNVVTTNALMLKPIQLTPPLALPSPTGPHHHHHHHHNIPYHHKYPIVQPMNVAYGGGGGNESSSEELNNNNAGYGGTSGDNSAPPYHHHQTTPFGMSPKKRFRTKFTQEQKDQMLEFADRVGWRLQKQDEEEVDRFCAEVGVKRQVLKVWMHNNKSTNVNKSSTAKHQLDHVSVMMGNLGNTVISAPPTHHDANIIAQVTTAADDHQLEEGELDT